MRVGSRSFSCRAARWFRICALASLAASLVGAAKLELQTNSIPLTGRVGSDYSGTAQAKGGDPPYSFSIGPGSLPTGLSMSAAGVISGAPTATGSSTFTLTVTDSKNVKDTAALTIVIQPALLTIRTTSPLPNGVVGVPYSQALTASGGTPPYRWSGSAPAGLALATNGSLAGTPTASGSFNLAAVVTDSVGVQANRTFAITITPALSITTTSPIPNATVGVAYSQNLSASGGVPPYRWTGTASAGLSLSLNGSITGTPTLAGNFNIATTVTDAASGTVSRVFAITIVGPSLTITTGATLPGGTVGVAYGQSLAAAGGTPPYKWSGTAPAGLSLASDGSITGAPNAPGAFSFAAQVTDSASATASRTFSLTIAAGSLSITSPSPLPNGTIGAPYTVKLAASGGTPPYRWSGAAPAGLALGADGSLSGSPVSTGAFNFSVQVSDSAGAQANKSFVITIDAANAPLTISTSAALSSATVRTPYSQGLSASGGTPPYSWSVVSGTLPAQLTLSADGVLSGSPSSVGLFSFVVQVTDATSLNFSKRFSLTVTSGLTITTAPTLPPAAVGSAYSQPLSSTGGVGTLIWSIVAGSLPAGLTMNGATGRLSGTPTAAGAYNFTVQLTDSSSAVATKQFALFSSAGLTISAAPALAGGSIGIAYSQAISATGGTPPLTWSVAAGQLPPGLTLDAASGVIAGLPSSSGSFDFTIQVSDNAGIKVAKAFTLSVAPGLIISNAPILPGGTSGAAYAQTLTAAGGRSPYLWSITAGALPPGLALDPIMGQISGVGTTPGSFSFTTQVNDANSLSATKQFTIGMGAAISIAAASPIPNPAAGAVYTLALTGNGGTPPFQWTVSAGSLPDGLSLNAGTGVLSGLPLSGGSFSFAIKVTDAAGAVATRDFTLNVDTPGLPALNLSAGPEIAAAAQQIALDLSFSEAYPLSIPGTVSMRFVPDPAVAVDDPAVQFSTGGRSVNFLIPANSTRPSPALALQTGTVTGSIEITVKAQGLPDLTRTITIARSAPAIRSLNLVKTATGFELRVSGFSTSRELTQATVRFTGVDLQTTELAVPLADISKAWYGGATSKAYGSQFSLTLPFTVQGDLNAIKSASLLIVNAQGPSTSLSVNF